ncbi:hypothetical protein V6N12_004683 [Hibiscus sabdariffa]|uniref:Uncharacterized protein n=1 Tax=Hibiscus sabdariffa TaxID=183260 RepID=A0ABR2CM81_9ROSI
MTIEWLPEVMNLIGDVKGKVAVMVDDMIDTAAHFESSLLMSCEDGTCTVKPHTGSIECLFVSSDDAHPCKLHAYFQSSKRQVDIQTRLEFYSFREQSAAQQFVVDKTCSKDPTGHST